MKMTVGTALDVVKNLATNIALFEAVNGGSANKIERIGARRLNKPASNKLKDKKAKAAEYSAALKILIDDQAETTMKRICNLNVGNSRYLDLEYRVPSLFSERNAEHRNEVFDAVLESERVLMIKVEDVAKIRNLIDQLVSTLESAKNDGVVHVVNGIDSAKKLMAELDQYHSEMSNLDKKDVDQEKVSDVSMFKTAIKKHKKSLKRADSNADEVNESSAISTTMSKK